jgi:hypothetical protein
MTGRTGQPFHVLVKPFLIGLAQCADGVFTKPGLDQLAAAGGNNRIDAAEAFQ